MGLKIKFVLFTIAGIFATSTPSFAGERLTADFTQEKTLSGFKTPLKSSGKVVIFSDFGIIWHQLRPFSTITKISQDAIETESTPGNISVIKMGEKAPSASIQELLHAIFSSDEASLSKNFAVTKNSLGKGKTRLTLKPKKEGQFNLFKEIDLVKGVNLESVLLEDPTGSKTAITFTNTHRKTVSKEEAQREFKGR